MIAEATARGETGGRPPEDSIRVMVVDDSAVIRGLTSKILASDPNISVVASVGN
ncbi:MAG: chemotaxis response regulator protein-glutamate methylesterase, partial [Alphaproteobacteria bacterium]|nr:chemotaxis response regulator protein-glutamate methylesterase [Alphaproteobacteria bacterium]